MKRKIFFIPLLILFFNNTGLSQLGGFTSAEKKYVELFDNFKNYLTDCINNNTDVTDSSQLNFILDRYIFINVKPDSINKSSLYRLSNHELTNLRKTLYGFYQFLQESAAQKISENLIAVPFRLKQNIFIYSQLTNFQKENTIVFYDKRYPKRFLVIYYLYR